MDMMPNVNKQIETGSRSAQKRYSSSHLREDMKQNKPKRKPKGTIPPPTNRITRSQARATATSSVTRISSSPQVDIPHQLRFENQYCGNKCDQLYKGLTRGGRVILKPYDLATERTDKEIHLESTVQKLYQGRGHLLNKFENALCTSNEKIAEQKALPADAANLRFKEDKSDLERTQATYIRPRSKRRKITQPVEMNFEELWYPKVCLVNID
jgi:hypothetical protein